MNQIIFHSKDELKEFFIGKTITDIHVFKLRGDIYIIDEIILDDKYSVEPSGQDDHCFIEFAWEFVD